MKIIEPRAAAASAVASRSDRPALAIIHEANDVRLVVFRIEAGQEVPPHRSASTVLLTVCEGEGEFTGGAEPQGVREGEVAVYQPNELHGMRALQSRFIVLATIAPRPGAA